MLQNSFRTAFAESMPSHKNNALSRIWMNVYIKHIMYDTLSVGYRLKFLSITHNYVYRWLNKTSSIIWYWFLIANCFSFRFSPFQRLAFHFSLMNTEGWLSAAIYANMRWLWVLLNKTVSSLSLCRWFICQSAKVCNQNNSRARKLLTTPVIIGTFN